MKVTTLPLLASMLLSLHSVLAQETYTITRPYNFPIKPGTQEWAGLNGHIEKVLACEIPVGFAKKMTTEALIQTCMDYPLYGNVSAYYGNQKSLDTFFNSFYGHKELATRMDAPAKLLAYYRNYTETVGQTNRLFNSVVSEYIHWFIKRPEFYAKYTDEQKQELAILSWRHAVSLYHRPKYSLCCLDPARIGLDLLINQGIVLQQNGQVLDSAKLPLGALKYCQGGQSIGKAEGNWLLDLITLVEPFVIK
jgi:hypothetical protein